MKPNTWPGWECIRVLGQGSYGYVYEIRKIEFGQEYHSALKVIEIPRNEIETTVLLEEGRNTETVDRYYHDQAQSVLREVQMMAAFKGVTNIVSYEDHMIIPKESAIGYYILIRMELLTPLPVFLEGNPLNDALMVKLGSDICRALEYCESKNVIHRDIKPANIFVNRFGDFKLGDFGIARSMSSANTMMTQRGTERYMAPEIYRGGQYGFQVDIYSLGLVLYQYLNNNRPPFCTQNDISYSDYRNALNRRIRGDVIPPPLYGSEELKRAVLRAVEYRPEDRLATAAEFREALQKAIELPGGTNKEPGAGDEIIRVEKKTNRETKKQQHTAFMILGAMCVILFMSFAAIIGGRMLFGTDDNDSDTVLTTDENNSDTAMTEDENNSDTAMTEDENNSDTAMTADKYNTETALTEAESLAASYDYDSAVALLEEQRNFDKDPDIIAAISKYTTLKSTLEAKDVTMVPNIIYQSLIVDPDRAYDASLPNAMNKVLQEEFCFIF